MYHELPVGAVVRLRNDKTATIVERPSHWVMDDNYPLVAVIEGEETPDSFTKEGKFYSTIDDFEGRDMVAVVHYGEPPRVKAPVVDFVAEALKGDTAPKPINRIERRDVENFKNRNFVGNLMDKYQEIATRSAIYPGQGTPFGIMYTALGLAEAGEIQNKVKKMFRDDGVIEFVDTPFRDGDNLVRFKTITPERRAAIIKEMGGNLWYLAALAMEIGTTLSEVAFRNLDELCGRTERDTLNGDGDDR